MCELELAFLQIHSTVYGSVLCDKFYHKTNHAKFCKSNKSDHLTIEIQDSINFVNRIECIISCLSINFRCIRNKFIFNTRLKRCKKKLSKLRINKIHLFFEKFLAIYFINFFSFFFSVLTRQKIIAWLII